MQKGLLLAILVSLVFTAHSQDQKLKLGLHAGPNLVGFHGKQGIRTYKKYRSDFVLGLDIEIPLGAKFSIKSGLEYEGKGQRIAFPATDENAMPIGTAEIHVSLDYLQMPLFASYKFSTGKSRFFADLGMYVGHLLSATTIEQPLGRFEGGKIIRTHEHTTFDFGIVAGLGIAFPLSDNIEGNIAIQDHLGLININKPEVESVEAKTHTIGLRLGAMVRI